MKSVHKDTIVGVAATVVILLFVLAFVFPIVIEPGSSYKTWALSNIKLIATSTQIYQSDYDERFPATSAMPGTRAVLMPYTKNGDFFNSQKDKFDRPQFNFAVAGVTLALTPYPGTKQLELDEVAVWSNTVLGEKSGMIVGRADTSARFYPPEKLAEAFLLFEGQFDRKGVTLISADYLADQDPLKESK